LVEKENISLISFGNIGIASVYMLNNELYGLPQDNALLIERFKKEVIHELGHAFGLIHCHTPTCVMRSSTYVEDIDLKGWHFYQSCRQDYRKISKS
jgi:archaemetzincin